MLLRELIYLSDTDEAYRVVKRLLDAVPAGSYLAIAHCTNEIRGAGTKEFARTWNQLVRPPVTLRSYQQITHFFDRLELLEPGVVSCPRWRPELTGSRDVGEFCGIARKP